LPWRSPTARCWESSSPEVPIRHWSYTGGIGLGSGVGDGSGLGGIGKGGSGAGFGGMGARHWACVMTLPLRLGLDD